MLQLCTVAFVVAWLGCASMLTTSIAAAAAPPPPPASATSTSSTSAAMLRGAAYSSRRTSSGDGTTTADPVVESWRQHQPPHGLPNILPTRLLTTIVVPETKLLVTVVPKAGSTSVAHLVTGYRAHLPGVSPEVSDFLLTGRVSQYTHWSRDIHSRSNPHAVGWEPEHARLAEVLADPSWRTIAIVRDPVARFVSAFVSKCIPGHDAGHPELCIFLPHTLLDSWKRDRTKRRVVQPDEWPTFEQAVQQVAAHLRGDAPLRSDIHWDPQTTLNGGLTNATARYYDGVVVYDSATFSRRLEQLLEFAGAGPEEAETAIAHMKAQRARMPSHRTGGQSTLCKLLTTQEQVDTLVSYYAEDYLEFAHLGISPPVLAELCG